MRAAVIGIAFCSIAAAAAAPAQEPAAGPRLVDECATPAGWAAPFTRVYHLRTGGTIVFVAVEHGRGPDTPTFRRIRAAIESARPDIVLVEGEPSARRDDAGHLQRVAAWARGRVADGTAQEPAYAIALAASHGIAFAGWDLSPADLYAISVAQGFAPADVVGAHLLRVRVDPAAPDVQRLITENLVGVTGGPPFDYPAWYKVHYRLAFNAALGTPCSAGIAGRIIKSETARRNANLAAVLVAETRPGRTVMVEAGAGHWLALSGYLASLSTDAN